jgi:hypothetical protein
MKESIAVQRSVVPYDILAFRNSLLVGYSETDLTPGLAVVEWPVILAFILCG